MTLAEQMIRFRAETNMSQKECAEKVGITLQTWMHVERELQTPSRLTEQKIRLFIEKEQKQ